MIFNYILMEQSDLNALWLELDANQIDPNNNISTKTIHWLNSDEELLELLNKLVKQTEPVNLNVRLAGAKFKNTVVEALNNSKDPKLKTNLKIHTENYLNLTIKSNQAITEAILQIYTPTYYKIKMW